MDGEYKDRRTTGVKPINILKNNWEINPDDYMTKEEWFFYFKKKMVLLEKKQEDLLVVKVL